MVSLDHALQDKCRDHVEKTAKGDSSPSPKNLACVETNCIKPYNSKHVLIDELSTLVTEDSQYLSTMEALRLVTEDSQYLSTMEALRLCTDIDIISWNTGFVTLNPDLFSAGRK